VRAYEFLYIFGGINMKEILKFAFATQLQCFLLQLRAKNPSCLLNGKIKQFSELISTPDKVPFNEFKDLLSYKIGLSYSCWYTGFFCGKVYALGVYINTEINGKIAVFVVNT
jgi:hypothetical protein